MTQQSGRIWVMGGRPLNGTAAIPAAKNSVLPLLAAALLCRGPVRLRAVPRLSDVECSLGLLRGAGCAAYWQGADIVVAGMPSNSTLPGETAAQMRASILFCAPLLARLGRAETSLPGGCNIGARPIDLHLEGLARMGAKELDAGAGKLVLAAPGGLHGADITLRFPSVGATETLLLAAACAEQGIEHITPVCADLRSFREGAGSYDLCACNPPYFTAGELAADRARATARHETDCTLDDVCKCAFRLLKDGGRLSLCHRPERLAEVLAVLRANRLEPKRLAFVKNRPDAAPWLFLVEAQKNRKTGLRVEPDVLISAGAALYGR